MGLKRRLEHMSCSTSVRNDTSEHVVVSWRKNEGGTLNEFKREQLDPDHESTKKIRWPLDAWHQVCIKLTEVELTCISKYAPLKAGAHVTYKASDIKSSGNTVILEAPPA